MGKPKPQMGGVSLREGLREEEEVKAHVIAHLAWASIRCLSLLCVAGWVPQAGLPAAKPGL